MRAIVVTLMLTAAVAAAAQTQINKSYPVKAGQTISMHFDYPDLIRVTTWDKNEVAITGTVLINGGENDEEFKLDFSSTDGTVYVKSQIPNLDNLPHRITITRDGKKIIFKNKEEYRKYKSEVGSDYSSMSWGSDVEIQLDVKVPKNTETFIKSVYGLIEVRNFSGALVAEATYGGIDAALVEKSTGALRAETSYGQIYSNLEIKFSGSEFRDFHTIVAAKLGSGPSYSFESKYGNVYLRKVSN